MCVSITVVFAAENQSVSSLDQEWIVVLKDPRPAQLRGWERGGYSGARNYSAVLELKRLGRQIARRYDLEIFDQWFIESLGVYCLVVRINDDRQITIADLIRDQRVKSVERSNRFELLHYDSKSTSIAELMDSPESHLAKALDGSGVSVAIVDSGVDGEHEDIKQAIRENKDFVAKVGQKPVAEAHGTAIAGIIVADQQSRLGVTGYAPAAKLSAFRGCWELGVAESAGPNCSTLTLAKALEAAVESEPDVLNLSLSGPADPLLDDLIRVIVSKGARVVAAFDPDRAIDNRFPSAQTGVIFVAAKSLQAKRLSSTLPSEVALVMSAPGAKIVAAPFNRANLLQGSSVAAAHISGVLTLCRQIENLQQKSVCNDALFAHLQGQQTNTLSELLTWLEAELD